MKPTLRLRHPASLCRAMVISALIFVTVLAFPGLRRPFIAQLRGDSAPFSIELTYFQSGSHGDAPAAPFGLSEGVKALWPKDIPWDELAKRYPNDARVQLVAAMAHEYQLAPSDPRSEARHATPELQFNAYDQALRQFPDVPDIIAASLRNILRGGLSIHFERYQDNSRSDTFYDPRRFPNLGELEKSLAAAQRGRRFEPDNCFFDMVAAELLFAMARDGEAMQVLHEGAQKPRYDDHVMSGVRARLYAARLQRPLLIEEKQHIWASALFPHLAHHRKLARYAARRAAGIARDGDRKYALKIYQDIMRLGARMRDVKSFKITSLVGRAMQHIAWSRTLPPDSTGKPDYAGQMTDSATGFMTYARQHGRPDLAEETARELKVNLSINQEDTSNTTLHREFPFLKPSLVPIWWMQTALLSQCLLCLSGWILLSAVIGLNARLRHEEAPPLRSLDITGTMLWTSGLNLVFLVTAGTLISRAILEEQPARPTDSSALAGLLETLRILSDYSTFVLAAMVVITATAWRLRGGKAPRPELSAGQRRFRLVRILAIGAALIGLALIGNLSVSARIMSVGPAGDVYNTILGFLADNSPLPTAACAAFIALQVFLVVRVVRFRRGIAPRQSLLSSYSLHWYRATIGATAVIANLAWLAIALYALPIRHNAEAEFDRYIRDSAAAEK